MERKPLQEPLWENEPRYIEGIKSSCQALRHSKKERARFQHLKKSLLQGKGRDDRKRTQGLIAAEIKGRRQTFDEHEMGGRWVNTTDSIEQMK